MHDPALFEESASPEDVASAARSFLAKLMAEEQLEARSHPLGFVHVSVPASGLRFHVWPVPRTQQRVDLLIHDHVFSFTSRVLTGVVENVMYDVASTPSGAHQLLRVDYEGNDSQLVPTRTRVRVAERSRVVIPRFGLYEVRAGEFHESHVPIDSIACTVVATHASSAFHPSVVGPLESDGVSFARTSVPDTRVREWLAQVASELRAYHISNRLSQHPENGD